MKRIVVALLASVFFGSVLWAQEPVHISKKNISVDVRQLSKYLQLTPEQQQKVKDINEDFKLKQKYYSRLKSDKRELWKRKAVYENFALMKATLNQEQYRKYITVFNITNSNYLQSERYIDVYLTEKK